jgi:hypothetical protein
MRAAICRISASLSSGTGELTGLTGEMQIKMPGGKHFYEFSYTLPDA